MPPKNSAKGKGKNKRKANSPLECHVDNTDQTEKVGGVSRTKLKKINRCIDNIAKTLTGNTNVDMNSSTTNTNMSYAAQPTAQPMYGMQTPQNPQHYSAGYLSSPMSQYSLPPPQNPSPQPGIPPWASELLEDIKELKSVLPSINKIEQTLSLMNAKMSDLEGNVKNIDIRVTEVENSCKFISQGFEKHSQELKTASETVKKVDKKCISLDATLKKVNEENETLKSKVLDLENRSMRNNLMFWGIPEQTNHGSPENCDNLVKKFISDELEVDATAMTFERAHRIPATIGPNTKTPRPMVVNFHYFQEREKVMAESAKRSQALRGKGYGVGPQRPKEIRDARRALRDVMDNARARGQHVRMYGDKLYINNKLYRPPPMEGETAEATSGN